MKTIDTVRTLRYFLLAGTFFLWPLSAASANQWTNLNPANSPGKKDGHLMAYDQESQRIILFGNHATDFIQGTWAYDPIANAWANQNPPTQPSSRAHGAMVYNTVHDVVILYGGQEPSGGPLGDTWSYDFNTNRWTNMAPPDPTPGPRRWHAMAYDRQSDRVILYGGDWRRSDTWAYDYSRNRWENRSPASGPPGMHFHAMAYNSHQDRILLVGFGQTWTYDYESNTWQQRASNSSIGHLGSVIPAMDYDMASRQFILINDDRVTWSYDYINNMWTNRQPSTSPVVHHHAMVYVPLVDRMILYAGRSPAGPIETWAYELGGGSPALPPAAPTGLRVQ